MSTIQRIFAGNRPAELLLGGAVAAGVLAATFYIIGALLLSRVVDRVFLGGSARYEILTLILVMLALFILRAGLIWSSDLLSQRSASIIKGGLRQRLSDQIFKLGPAYTSGERSGELVNTIIEGIETLDAYITQYLPAQFLAGIVPLVVFVVVLVLDPWTTLVYLFAGPMVLLLMALIGGRARAITEKRFLEMSWMSAFFLDVLQGLATLKMFGRSREQADNIEQISRHYGDTTMEVLRTAFQTSLVLEWSATAATAMVALEVSLRLMNGAIPFTVALGVLLLTPEFFLPIRQLALRYHSGTAGRAAAQRVFAILDTPARRVGYESLPEQPPSPGMPSQMEIRFDQVSFAYEQGERPALKDFSLVLRLQQTVAVIGPTGAGKTTISQLLLRFIEPDRGRITIAGQDLLSIDRRSWLRNVAWVPQQPHLFHGSLAENIRLARPDASMEAVVAASKAANAHEFITAFTHGYDTQVGERGARLSGGQLQRIAIARAFLKDAQVLILDEATAHLDRQSEALIGAALEKLMHARTVLIIAHRLKLAYSADRIVVMEGGRAIQSGNHSELLAQEGLYRQLVSTYESGLL